MYDVVVILFVALLAFVGLWKGFVKQVVGFAGIVAGYMIAMKFSGGLADRFLSGFLPVTRHVIGFVAVFLACIVAASLLGWIIGKAMSSAGLGIPNRLAGGLLGAAKGWFVVAVATMFVIAFLPHNSKLLHGSRTLQYVRPVAGTISNYAPRYIKSRYDERTAIMDRRPEKRK